MEDEDPTAAAFRRAAQALKEKREEEQMLPEDRIYKYALLLSVLLLMQVSANMSKLHI